MRDLAGRYRDDLAREDPIKREIARRQIARLSPSAPVGARPVTGPSRWAHVPLVDLFAEQGNRVRRRADGRLECGHEPIHGSTSGGCVLLDPARGRWWCRSCRQSGDAPAYLAGVHGCRYRDAAELLAGRFGRAAGRPGSGRRRRRLLEAVLP